MLRSAGNSSARQRDREDGFGLKRSGDEEPSDLSKAKQSSKKKDSKKKKKQKQGGWIASAADYI